MMQKISKSLKPITGCNKSQTIQHKNLRSILLENLQFYTPVEMVFGLWACTEERVYFVTQ